MNIIMKYYSSIHLNLSIQTQCKYFYDNITSVMEDWIFLPWSYLLGFYANISDSIKKNCNEVAEFSNLEKKDFTASPLLWENIFITTWSNSYSITLYVFPFVVVRDYAGGMKSIYVNVRCGLLMRWWDYFCTYLTIYIRISIIVLI